MRSVDLGPLAPNHKTTTGGRNRSPSGAWRAFDKLRTATPDVVQRAVARVASYSTLHLYRGELFTRNVRETGELTLSLFTKREFDALPPAERERYIARLDLQEAYCRQKWDRGDTVVLAMESGTPAGILWCARTPVYVPDIGREVRPGAGECYIHDVYVHPDERGRQVAPAMLDFLARELRGRDVYRAWALIERTNVASTRAFEKAAYASVSDVVYARMGLASRLIVRPPDPEARAFLGLS
jgi:GNAT superfamily N-acetyltransferase